MASGGLRVESGRANTGVYGTVPVTVPKLAIRLGPL